jgi:hypothetical protein
MQNMSMNIRRIVIIGCATLDSNRYQRPLTNEEIFQVGANTIIDLVDPQFEITCNHLDSDIEINKLCMKVFPISAEKYFNNIPIHLLEIILIYDFTGNTTRNEFAKMINKDINLMHNNIIYYPMGCMTTWNKKLLNPDFIELNPPYNKFINVNDDIMSYKHLNFRYINRINKLLFAAELHEYNSNIHKLCAYIKARYYTYPVPLWCTEKQDNLAINVDSNNIYIILKKLVKWFNLNGGIDKLDIDTEKNIIYALDTIRKFKIK